MEDSIPRRVQLIMIKATYLSFMTCVVSHLLACALAGVDTFAVDGYLELHQDPQTSSAVRRYLVAVYWAVTTVSTVGYGDITPTTDAGRVYVSFAMVVGGAFYGYSVGLVTSLITSIDIDSRTFNERMETLNAWLDRHHSLPQHLRRRIRRHFRVHWKQVVKLGEDSVIIQELTRELRGDAAFYIVPEEVRKNPMFLNLHSSALATLVALLKKASADGVETIVSKGDPGTAMYVIVDGSAHVTEGSMWMPADLASVSTQSEAVQHTVRLLAGDSFGEEFLLENVQDYSYTIVALTRVCMYEILEDDFKTKLRNLPDLRKRMHNNVRAKWMSRYKKEKLDRSFALGS